MHRLVIAGFGQSLVVCDDLGSRVSGLFLGVPQMIEFLYIFVAIGKSLAVWVVPFAVVAYVVTYFVMALIFLTFWKQERGPWIRPFLEKIGKRDNPEN